MLRQQVCASVQTCPALLSALTCNMHESMDTLQRPILSNTCLCKDFFGSVSSAVSNAAAIGVVRFSQLTKFNAMILIDICQIKIGSAKLYMW